MNSFSNESALRIRWPKDWSFSFNISPTNEHPRLVSFRMDWLDLLEEGMAIHSIQYSCLENPMDRGAWWAAVLGGHKESDTNEATEHSRMRGHNSGSEVSARGKEMWF